MKVKRDVVDSAVKTALATSGKPVGLSDTPSEVPDRKAGWYVLYQSPCPAPEGSWGDPEDCRYLDYQVKSVGKSHRQCAWLSSKAQEIMTGLAAGGYATPIAVSGYAIIDRRTVSNGAIRPGAGSSDLFEVDDIYRLAVTSAG